VGNPKEEMTEMKVNKEKFGRKDWKTRRKTPRKK
jgi:hypothetical protein